MNVRVLVVTLSNPLLDDKLHAPDLLDGLLQVRDGPSCRVHPLRQLLRRVVLVLQYTLVVLNRAKKGLKRD